ncbi:hypothetical protein [Pseudorhodoferax sp. Leaf267]|uniref:hypothetical protein n=1 Tax=Pseudorhodoferax sp. Leaf267 TaxID=1736316 RepID=UPI0006FE72B5|nr:hypothetical protein [Pseudorhodoferax sp. Leaf267]KQP23347.1 hypothetical protein ASF43_05655 [Pseudorhodoferax sp. Leaf267]
MEELLNLSEVELERLAASWRAEALRGVREARGQAHLCEAELRRRRGAVPVRDHRTLDLRPLESRQSRPRWWAFWSPR